MSATIGWITVIIIGQMGKLRTREVNLAEAHKASEQ